MGRPKSKYQKPLTVRLTEQEYQIFKEDAQQNYRTTQQSVRMVIERGLKELVAEGVLPEPK